MSKLNGKIAVITGGSSGIGLAAAKKFVDEGAYVFIMGRRQSELDKAKALIGKNVTAVQGDVADLGDLAVKADVHVLGLHAKPLAARRRIAAGSFVAEPCRRPAADQSRHRPQGARRRRRQRSRTGVDRAQIASQTRSAVFVVFASAGAAGLAKTSRPDGSCILRHCAGVTPM